MKKLSLIHPYLFAVIPILFLYSHNLDEAQFSNVILPSLIMICAALISYYILSFFTKNTKLKGLIITFFLAAFFSYGIFFNLFEGLRIGGFLIGREKYLFAAWCLIFAAGVYLITRLNKKTGFLDGLTSVLNAASVAFILIIVFNVLTHNFKKPEYPNNEIFRFVHVKSGELNKSQLPNIYYIILDGYGNSRILKEIYGFDNSGFEKFLTRKGFYIASQSRSNYSTTMQSLASSLNMIHLPNNSTDIPMLYDEIQENNVMRIFNMEGYSTVCISSNITQLQHINAADLNVHCGSFLADEFHTVLIEQTLLSAFNKYFNFAYFYREKVLNAFSKLVSIQQEVPNPLFAFVHILPPHPPYVFGPKAEPMFGSLSVTKWEDPWTQKELYIDQVRFVNKEIENAVSKILSESKRPSVILIQSDHGPRYLGSGIPMKTTVDARMNIFNAIYLPKTEKNIFYGTVTPVNSFRLIFNKYFRANYPMLPDRSYFNVGKSPYKFIDVTDSLDVKLKGDSDFVD